MTGRFDWYQATVQADVGALLGVMEGAVSEGRPTWQGMSKAPHGYAYGRRLSDDAGQVCMVWWGGTHTNPHVVGSGDSAHRVAEVLRTEYPHGAHRVTRVDSCIDYAEAGAYERLEGIALGVARERKIRVNTAGDHLVTKEGRTVYLGAPTSHTRLRLYEKADELRAKFKHQPDKLAAVPEHLARLECQVRPQTHASKMAAAQCSPIELMGSSAWMRELMHLVAGLELEPFQAGRPWRQADDDRAYAALLAQYGGLLQRMRVDLGSWDCLGLQIGHDLAERSQANKR